MLGFKYMTDYFFLVPTCLISTQDHPPFMDSDEYAGSPKVEWLIMSELEFYLMSALLLC